MYRFGEDKKYDHRMIVLYDGVHYDPVYMETFEVRKEDVYITTTTTTIIIIMQQPFYGFRCTVL